MESTLWGPTIWGPTVSRATDFGSREPLTGLGAYSLGAYSLQSNIRISKESGGLQSNIRISKENGAYSLGAYNLGAYSLSGYRFWVSGSKHLFFSSNIEDPLT